MSRARWTASAVAVTALLASARLEASPADLFGVGARSQALAGAGAADAEGYEATYGNPALLARERRRRLNLGWQVATFRLRADGPAAPGALSTEALRGTQLGAVLPLPFGGALEERLTLGLAVFTPRDLIVRARLLYPERLQYPVLADRAQSLSFALGLGAALGGGLRVGVGAQVLAELVGTAVVRTDSSGRVGTVVDDQLIATWAPLAGISYQPLRGLDLGLTWRGELSASFDVVVSVFDLGALVIPDLNIAGVAQYDPMQVEFGAAYSTGPWRWLGGLSYKRWSQFPGWQSATVRCPPRLPDCAALRPVAVDFTDTVVPRLAVELSLPLTHQSVGRVRAGWFFEPSPVPEQRGLSNVLDADRHVLTLGYGVRLLDPLPPLEVETFYQHHFLVGRTNTKRAGLGCPASAPSCEPNSGAPSVTAGGSAQTTGVNVGVRF